MRKFYTAEAVTEGHPDKLCDQIADAILDVCLKQDEQSRVACEVLATKGTIIVAGEITSTYEPDVFAVVRKVLSDSLRLTRPIFRQTAAFGHFGRKEFPWERTDKVEALRNAVI